jgi:hypothetical protein
MDEPTEIPMRIASIFLATVACSGLFAEGAAPVAPGVDGEKHEKELNEKSSVVAWIKHLDADKNGELSAAELAVVTNEKVKEKLAALDTTKDGGLDKAEIEAAKAAMKEKKEKGEHKEGDKKEGEHKEGEHKEGEHKEGEKKEGNDAK